MPITGEAIGYFIVFIDYCEEHNKGFSLENVQ